MPREHGGGFEKREILRLEVALALSHAEADPRTGRMNRADHRVRQFLGDSARGSMPPRKRRTPRRARISWTLTRASEPRSSANASAIANESERSLSLRSCDFLDGGR